jgi:hypothetical protein
MKRSVSLSLAASLAATLVVVGCTINSTETNNDSPNQQNTDAGSDTGTSADAGTDGDTPPAEIDEAVGNDSLDAAQAVPLGTRVKATINAEGDDYFSITVPAGAHDGVLHITLDEADPDFTPGIRIYSSAKTELVNDYVADSTTRPFDFEFNVTAGKLYYIEVFNGHGETPIPYTLQPKFTAVADPFERNDSFDTAKAAPIGEAFDLVLFAGADTNEAQDVDYFTIEAPSGKSKVRVKITNTAEQYHGVKLFGSNKADLGTIYAAGEQADVDDVLDLADSNGGTYYLQFFNGHSKATASKVTVSFE